MTDVAISSGSIMLYWSGLIIALGILAGFLLSYSIWIAHTNKGAAMWVFLPFAIVFSVLFARLLHYYCHDEQYASFFKAITDYSTGGYALSGVIFGVMLSAFIVKKLGLVKRSAALLDALAPGVALTLAIIRVASFFGNGCRSKFSVKSGFFRRLPFAIAMTDAAGNTEYRFATFFVESILFLIVMLLLLNMFYRERKPMKQPEKRSGHVARIGLAMYCAIELVLDSTRYDSLTIHFRTSLLQGLNKFASFIKVAQVISAVALLCLLAHYIKMSSLANGKKWYHTAAWVGFFAATAAVGYLGEYWVQRAPETALLRYAVMSAGMLADTLIIYLMYRTCIYKEDGL